MDRVFSLKKFDPSTIKLGSVVGIVGGRGSGKSLLVRDLMYTFRKLPLVVVMSGTEEGNGFYGKFVPGIFVYSEFRKDVLENLLQQQRKIKEQKRNRNVLVVLDDLLYDSKTIMKESIMRFLFMNGRHMGITIIVVAQFANDLGPPALRSQLDYVVAFREPSIANRERLYKMFYGIVPTFQDFNAILAHCTEEYRTLVVHQTAKTNDMEKAVFWYKADVSPSRLSFRMGHPAIWKFHDRHFRRPEDREQIEKEKSTIKVFTAK